MGSAVIPVRGARPGRLEWGAEPNALGFYERIGGRFLCSYVTEWGREGQWCGMEL
jgi:hypothetical protein